MGPWPYPDIIAHRGAGRHAPENTLAAIRAGAALGHRMVEFDVKLSADGVPVLMHDDTLERTTNGRGRVADQPLASLRRLDAGGGEPVPTLAEVSDLLLSQGILANIELKPCAGRERETGAVVAAWSEARWRGATTAPLLSSFSPTSLAAAREAAPSLPRALLVERVTDATMDLAAELGCVALDAHHLALDGAVVRRVRARGLRLLAWTVNDPSRAAALLAWGVDGVITDAVDLLRPRA